MAFCVKEEEALKKNALTGLRLVIRYSGKKREEIDNEVQL